MINLNRKVAIVTGSTGGLGLGISLVLANQGAYVAALATSEGKLKDLDLIMRQHGHHETRYFVANVSDDDSTKVAVRAVLEHYGKIDILVNNAGVVAAPGWEDRIDSSDADWALNYEVNLRGLARVIDTVVPHMKNQKSGKIVNISSGAARQPGIHLPPAYGATKEGVINLTKYYALALAPFNINVNAICPGTTLTTLRAQTVRWDPPGGQLGFNQVTELALVFENCEPDGDPKLPRVDGLNFGRPSQSSQTSIVNFKMSRTFSFVFPVRAETKNPITIPAFEIMTDKGPLPVKAARFTVGEATLGNSGLAVDDIVEDDRWSAVKEG